jgi:hypothetical protein
MRTARARSSSGYLFPRFFFSITQHPYFWVSGKQGAVQPAILHLTVDLGPVWLTTHADLSPYRVGAPDFQIIQHTPEKHMLRYVVFVAAFEATQLSAEIPDDIDSGTSEVNPADYDMT